MTTHMDNQSILSAIAAMESQLQSLRLSISGSAPSGKKQRKAKDPSAPKRAPTAWALLCQSMLPRISALYKSSFPEEKAPLGFPMRVCKYLKDNGQIDGTTDAQIVEAITYRRANPEPAAASGAASDAGSVASAPASTTEPKPKRVLSDAQKQKMAEGRARKAAEKKAAAEAAAASVVVAPATEAPVSSSASVAGSEATAETTGSKARGRPKGYKMTEEAKAAAAAKRAAKKAAAPAASATTAASADTDSELSPILLKNKRYFYNSKTHGLWFREDDGSCGIWAGILNPVTKVIDDGAAEPMSADEISDNE